MGEPVYKLGTISVPEALKRASTAFLMKWSCANGREIPFRLDDDEIYWQDKASEVYSVIERMEAFIDNTCMSGKLNTEEPLNLGTFLRENLPYGSFIVLSEGLEIVRAEFDREGKGVTYEAVEEWQKQHKARYSAENPKDEAIREYLAICEAEKFVDTIAFLDEERHFNFLQDQPQQTPAPAGNQEAKKDTPIIEAVKSWEPGKTRPKIFYTEIDKIKKRLEVGTDQAINSFCRKYGFSGQEKAFEKSYECHCKTLAKKRKDRTTIKPR
jgi:hypothetical protein